MSRSLWKGVVCLKGITGVKNGVFFGHVKQKNAVITSDLVNGTLTVAGMGRHDVDEKVKLSSNKIGHRLGEFIRNKQLVLHLDIKMRILGMTPGQKMRGSPRSVKGKK